MGWLILIGTLQVILLGYIAFRLERLADVRQVAAMLSELRDTIRAQGDQISN